MSTEEIKGLVTFMREQGVDEFEAGELKVKFRGATAPKALAQMSSEELATLSEIKKRSHDKVLFHSSGG